jgi:outer membrane lipoprotein SlyB
MGAIVLLPFAFIDYAGLALAARFAIVAAIGAVAGSAVGFVVGPSLGARRRAIEGASAGNGQEDRPGKAEIAEATGEHEDGRTRRRRTA